MAQSKRQFWTNLLSEFDSCNQTVSSFCDINEVPVWQFYYWKKRLKQSNSTFEEVSILEDVNSSGIHLSVGSLNIHVQNNFSESTLRRVLSTLSC